MALYRRDARGRKTFNGGVMVAEIKGSSPMRPPDDLDARLRSLNEERAVFVIRALVAAGKISSAQIIRAIDLADSLGVGN